MSSRRNLSREVHRRPRIFYGWYIVGAGMGIHLWMSVAWIYGMQIFFSPISAHFGWSHTAMAGAFSLQRLEGSIASPVEGFLVDRFGPRKLILAGGLISGSGLIFLSSIQTISMFYASVLLVSLGMSASVGIPRTWSIVHWFRRLRGRALGIGSSGAVVSGPLLIILVWLINTLGWQNAFVVLGIATWVICIPLGLVFRSRPQELGYLPDGDFENLNADSSSTQAEAKKPLTDNSFSVRQALRSQMFWLMTLVFSLQTMGISGMMVFLVPYFEGPDVGFSTAQAASVLGVFTLLSVFGRLGTGWAMDYWNQRIVLIILLACQATAFLLLANITDYWQIFPFAFLYGTAFGGMMPSRGFMVSSLFGIRNFGTIQGLMQSGTVIGGLIAPLLMGRSFDITNSYVPAIYMLGGVAVLAIPIVLLLRPPRHE